jgi:phage shock protein C
MDNTKKLYRSRQDRKIAGIAGGLGEYFEIDPVLIRVAFVLLALFSGSGIILYLILMLVIPDESTIHKI